MIACEYVGYDDWEYTGEVDDDELSDSSESDASFDGFRYDPDGVATLDLTNDYSLDYSSDESTDMSDTSSELSSELSPELSPELSLDMFRRDEYKPRRRVFDMSIVLFIGVAWALWKVP